jgi:hypothetical protein
MYTICMPGTEPNTLTGPTTSSGSKPGNRTTPTVIALPVLLASAAILYLFAEGCRWTRIEAGEEWMLGRDCWNRVGVVYGQ